MMLTRRTAIVGMAAAASRLALAVPADDERLYTAGLVLPPGPAGRCDDARVGGPVVRWDEALGGWRMWYYCRDRRFPAGIAPAFGSGSIATAISRNGRQWERTVGPLPGGAVFAPSREPGAFDTTHVATGDVVRVGDEWLMAYHGGNHETPRDAAEIYQHPGYVLRIGLAASKDGVHWRRLPGAATGGSILEAHDGDVYAAFPALLQDEDRYLLHYTTIDKRGRYARSRVAVSADLSSWRAQGELAWDGEPPPFEGGGVVTRDIVEHFDRGEARWMMVYTARDGRTETSERRSIAAAVSSDGLSWRRLPGGPIFSIGRRGSWDSGGVANPRLVVTATDLRLYYYGWSDSSHQAHPFRGLGCAVAPGRDLSRLRRVDS